MRVRVHCPIAPLPHSIIVACCGWRRRKSGETRGEERDWDLVSRIFAVSRRVGVCVLCVCRCLAQSCLPLPSLLRRSLLTPPPPPSAISFSFLFSHAAYGDAPRRCRRWSRSRTQFAFAKCKSVAMEAAHLADSGGDYLTGTKAYISLYLCPLTN